LLDGSACSAEIVRSLQRHKKLRFIDRLNRRDESSEATARFEVNADQYIKEKALGEDGILPSQENRQKNWKKRRKKG
jgi:hypothetical protein